jgi:hypothetical protein
MNYVKSIDGGDVVTNTSKIIVSPNNRRRAVAITNSSPSVIWVNKGPTATVGQGIELNALGGSFTDDRDGDGSIYTDVYSAIAVTAGSNVLGHQEDFFE